ncbi:MAG: hypothetical protein ACJ8R9_19135 [Steroidobacteraceae bacterium]
MDAARVIIRLRCPDPSAEWIVGLGYPLVPEPFIKAGHKLETAIYLHWRRQREDLGYLGGERKIDLVVNLEQPELLVNVAAHIDRPEVYDREIRVTGGAGVGGRANAAGKAHVGRARGSRRETCLKALR